MEKHLALLGGEPLFKTPLPEELLKWPIITEEDEAAVLDVLRRNAFSGTDITQKFEEEFAAWQGTKHALAFCNGTAALYAAMFAIGLGAGDEIICPTKTYWASITSAMSLGAVPVFCNINEMLSIDPDDLEKRITPRTKAIMVVHYMAYPADMDRIMAIAKRHHLLVIEDVSHAQGGYYKGKKLGTFGDVAAMSLMSGKSFAAGELGILVTDNRRYYERAVAFGHYERFNPKNIVECTELLPFCHIPLGGFKGRANQASTAMARVQLKYYDERCREIRSALNFFFDCLADLPGIRAIRVDESEGSTMAGWYLPHAIYHPEELDGLSLQRFCQAVNAELKGASLWQGGNRCLHTHRIFHDFDRMHLGKPDRIAFADADVRAGDALCAPSEEALCFSVPYFKHKDEAWIRLTADALRKVITYRGELLSDESAHTEMKNGRWYGTTNE